MSPVFHGYWSAIEAALTACGHEVTTYCYDSGNGPARLRNAVAHRIRGAQLPAAAPDQAASTLRNTRPDAILVVKGDTLNALWWDAVARSGARTAVWLYDELTRMKYSTQTLAAVDAVFSYSPDDVAALNKMAITARHLPDGYDALTHFTPRHSEAVSFVGARYPAREQALVSLAARGIPVIAYGREWSRHPWDILRTGRWKPAGVAGERDLPRADYYGIMAGSVATLNVHGDGHDGFSMRTFEAPGVGALQLIDRPDVGRHYDVGSEVLVFTTTDELAAHIEHAQQEPTWAQTVRDAGRRRTLAEHTLTHRMREVAATWA